MLALYPKKHAIFHNPLLKYLSCQEDNRKQRHYNLTIVSGIFFVEYNKPYSMWESEQLNLFINLMIQKPEVIKIL